MRSPLKVNCELPATSSISTRCEASPPRKTWRRIPPHSEHLQTKLVRLSHGASRHTARASGGDRSPRDPGGWFSLFTFSVCIAVVYFPFTRLAELDAETVSVARNAACDPP